MGNRVLNNRFELRTRLGAGAEGDVFDALDRLSQKRCALKIICVADRARANRLRAEFRRLARVAHPHLVAVFDIGVDEDDPEESVFFTSELIEGQVLSKWASALGDKVSPLDALDLLEEVAGALDELHRARVIHCDVKPDNILVNAERGAVLLDLGLSVGRGARGSARGTLGYMDERALAGEPDCESDLHALGVTFYSAIAGCHPYPADSPRLLADALAAAKPDPFAVHVPDWPAPIGELIDALIRPRQRPRTSTELLSRIWSVRVALGVAETRKRARPRGDGPVPRIVGREDIVVRAIEAISLRTPLVVVRAEAGVGAGAVLEEVACRAQLEALGRGVELEVLRGNPSVVVDELCRDQEPRLTALEGRARLVASADAALAQLAERAVTRSVLWVVDHDHPFDDRVGEIAAALAAGHLGLVDAPVTVIGKFDRLSADAILATRAIAIEIEPLDVDAIGALAVSLLGQQPSRRWLEELKGLCLGRPAMIATALAEAAALPAEPDDIDPAGLVAGEDAASIATYLDRAARRIDDDAATVLAATAIAHQPVTAGQIAELVERPESAACEALVDLTALGWLQEREERFAMVSTAHSEAAQRRLRATERKHLHRRFLESDESLSPARLARHLAIVGPAKAATTAFATAAEYHHRRGELSLASEAIETAIKRAEGTELSRLSVIAASVDLDRAHYKNAIAHAARAARSRDPQRSRQASLLGARAKQRAGDFDGAKRELFRLVARDQGDFAAQGALAKIHVLQGDYELAAAIIAALPTQKERADRDGLELCLEAEGLVKLYDGDHSGADGAFDRLRRLALAREDNAMLGRSLALGGLAAHHAGQIALAAERYGEAAQLARAHGQIHAAASAHINRAAADSERGHFARALRSLDSAIAMLRRMGNVSELAAALYNRAHCLFALGDMASANETALRARDVARDTGRSQFELYTNLVLGDVARRQGDSTAALAAYGDAEELAAKGSAVRDRTSVSLNMAELLAELGDERALEHLEAAEQAGSREHERIVLSRGRISLSLGVAAQGLFEAVQPLIEKARAGGREDLHWRLAALAARLAAAEGEREQARSYARTARWAQTRMLDGVPTSRHEAMGQDPDVLALAALESELELSTLRDLSVVTSQPAWATRLLGLSSRLNSELRLEPLLDQVIDTAIELAGAERGFLLLAEGGNLEVAVARNIDQHVLRTGDETAVSRSIAERAARSGEVVLALDAAFDERFDAAESVAAMRLRSVLAVPLRFRRALIGTIYVDHRFRSGAFGDHAVQLVRELANIAGVAIGNARILAESRKRAVEIDDLNRQLEEELGERESELAAVKSRLPTSEAPPSAAAEIKGTSPAIRELHQLVERMAKAPLPVVITGESGSGKELVARALHRLSSRRGGPFVAVNCAAVTDSLLESELFGHVRGAFTGANRNRRGHFEVADGGTLFLDEIADTSTAMQTKLLRVLQEGELRRVGDEELRRVDVRVVAATNRELSELVERGEFREDLYFRLNVLAIRVPPLRERKGDIAELVEHLLERVARGAGITIAREALKALAHHHWPGNVRELENELARAAALADSSVIELSDLTAHFATAPCPAEFESALDLKLRVENLERELIGAALEKSGGNQTKAAKILGLSRYGLQKKLKRYAL